MARRSEGATNSSHLGLHSVGKKVLVAALVDHQYSRVVKIRMISFST